MEYLGLLALQGGLLGALQQVLEDTSTSREDRSSGEEEAVVQERMEDSDLEMLLATSEEDEGTVDC